MGLYFVQRIINRVKLPNMDSEARKSCWAARDLYFHCLDTPKADCNELYTTFTGQCPASWVKHFVERRDLSIREMKRKQLEEEANKRRRQ